MRPRPSGLMSCARIGSSKKSVARTFSLPASPWRTEQKWSRATSSIFSWSPAWWSKTGRIDEVAMEHLEKMVPLAVLGVVAAILLILLRRAAREQEITRPREETAKLLLPPVVVLAP